LNYDGTVLVYCSSASNLVPGDFNNFDDAFAYVTPPPKIQSVQINPGAPGPQRSIVRSLSVVFDEPVFFSGDPAAAFSLFRPTNPGQPVTLSANVVTGATTTVTFTFSGMSTQFGSLVDGDFTLIANASQISNIAPLDGNGDGTGNDDYVSPAGLIARLFGDSDGSRKVDADDFTAFRSAYGPAGIFNAAFDFYGDGQIDLLDYARFRPQYGKMLP
jgi:hypothetical protein